MQFSIHKNIFYVLFLLIVCPSCNSETKQPINDVISIQKEVSPNQNIPASKATKGKSNSVDCWLNSPLELDFIKIESSSTPYERSDIYKSKNYGSHQIYYTLKGENPKCPKVVTYRENKPSINTEFLVQVYSRFPNSLLGKLNLVNKDTAEVFYEFGYPNWRIDDNQTLIYGCQNAILVLRLNKSKVWSFNWVKLPSKVIQLSDIPKRFIHNVNIDPI